MKYGDPDQSFLSVGKHPWIAYVGTFGDHATFCFSSKSREVISIGGELSRLFGLLENLHGLKRRLSGSVLFLRTMA